MLFTTTAQAAVTPSKGNHAVINTDGAMTEYGYSSYDSLSSKDKTTVTKAITDNKNAYTALLGVVNSKDSTAVNGWNASAVSSAETLNQFKSARTKAVSAAKTPYYSSLSNADLSAVSGLTASTSSIRSLQTSLSSSLKSAMDSHEDKKASLMIPGLKSKINTANALVASSHNRVSDNATRIRLANQVKAASNYVKTAHPRVNQVNAHINALNILMNSVRNSQAAWNRAQAAHAAYIRSIRVVKTVNSTMNCTPSRGDPVCQHAVDTKRLVHIRYSFGTSIFAQHNYAGGNWINGLAVGQGVRVNGVLYVVKSVAVRQTVVPTSGIYLQTCTTNGQGIRLVRIVQP
jgi:hypothetical protein